MFGQQALLDKGRVAMSTPPADVHQGEVGLWCKGHVTAPQAQDLVSFNRQVFVWKDSLFTSENFIGHLHSISGNPP